MIDIFSVKTWEFSDKEKEARSKAVGSEAVETEAVISEEVEAVRPVIPNIPRVREAVKAVEAEAVEAEAVEAVRPEAVEADRPAPDRPRRKKTFYDIALEILGKQCNKTRSVLIDEMITRYNISEAVATSGLEKLISNNVIELTTVETNVQRYYMTDSTPF